MREPHFWRDIDPRSRAAAPLTRLLLSPLAALYTWDGARRLRKARPYDCGRPVVCVGNLTLGGAGKTPIVEAIRAHLVAQGLRAASLSRGYGGSLKGPVRVDPERHDAGQVGDEPLMLSATGESWIARQRADGARAMVGDGVDVIVMDDGHQNPDLVKTSSLVVIDSSEPFGNGFVFPKGPLREPVEAGMARADGVILMGSGETPEAAATSDAPVWRARLTAANDLPAGGYVAFAGIGRPERFFDSLRLRAGLELCETVPFGDHHVYSAGDVSYLAKLAKERGAHLVTTSKDHVRLPREFGEQVAIAAVRVDFAERHALDAICAGLNVSGAAQ